MGGFSPIFGAKLGSPRLKMLVFLYCFFVFKKPHNPEVRRFKSPPRNQSKHCKFVCNAFIFMMNYTIRCNAYCAI